MECSELTFLLTTIIYSMAFSTTEPKWRSPQSSRYFNGHADPENNILHTRARVSRDFLKQNDRNYILCAQHADQFKIVWVTREIKNSGSFVTDQLQPQTYQRTPDGHGMQKKAHRAQRSVPELRNARTASHWCTACVCGVHLRAAAE